jgi:hypothetical protein
MKLDFKLLRNSVSSNTGEIVVYFRAKITAISSRGFDLLCAANGVLFLLSWQVSYFC